jgi:hypothetical protein
MRKARVLSILFVVVPLPVAVIADAQQPTKVHWIGYLSTGNPTSRLLKKTHRNWGLASVS